MRFVLLAAFVLASVSSGAQAQSLACDAFAKNADVLLQSAPTIERDLQRLRELREALPHVEVIFLNRTHVQQAEETAHKLATAIRELDDQLAQLDHHLETARWAKENLHKRPK